MLNQKFIELFSGMYNVHTINACMWPDKFHKSESYLYVQAEWYYMWVVLVRCFVYLFYFFFSLFFKHTGNWVRYVSEKVILFIEFCV